METKGETESMIPEKQVICYKTIGETEITADVYLPEGSSKPMPLFFYIHSGGWIDGKADELLVNFTDLTERLFADGVASRSTVWITMRRLPTASMRCASFTIGPMNSASTATAFSSAAPLPAAISR